MPITILDKDQELEFVAIAKMGLGITHAKFSPGIIFYRYTNDLAQEDDESFKKLVEESKKDEEKEMEFFIESWGQISPKEMFIQSIDTLNEEIGEFLKQIK